MAAAAVEHTSKLLESMTLVNTQLNSPAIGVSNTAEHVMEEADEELLLGVLS